MSVESLIKQLEEIRYYLISIEQLAPEAKTGDGAVMLHAIESIKVLQEIASEERFTICDARELIEEWFESVEAK